MRRRPRRAFVDHEYPRGWGTSDRSGFVGQHNQLRWQYEWRGTELVNTRVLVDASELDVPQDQLRAFPLPSDPVPVMNARVEPYAIDEVWPMLMESNTSYDEIPIHFESSTVPGIYAGMMNLSLETSTIA